MRQNVFKRLDPKTGRPEYNLDHKPVTGQRVQYCPWTSGGKNWPPAAYSPRTKLLYIPANDNLCVEVAAKPVEYQRGQQFIGIGIEDVVIVLGEGAKQSIGELQAWSLDEPRKVWTQKFKAQNWGPVLATAGDLIFMGGTSDRYFRAFNARTGEILWQQRTNSGVIGVPVSYEVDGVQHIAVLSGYGGDAASIQDLLNPLLGTSTYVPQGGVLWVFALPSEAALQ